MRGAPEHDIDGLLVVARHEIRLQVVEHPLAACIAIVPRRRLVVEVHAQCLSMHHTNTVFAAPATAWVATHA